MTAARAARQSKSQNLKTTLEPAHVPIQRGERLYNLANEVRAMLHERAKLSPILTQAIIEQFGDFYATASDGPRL